jgi:hypothetical protein
MLRRRPDVSAAEVWLAADLDHVGEGEWLAGVPFMFCEWCSIRSANEGGCIGLPGAGENPCVG